MGRGATTGIWSACSSGRIAVSWSCHTIAIYMLLSVLVPPPAWAQPRCWCGGSLLVFLHGGPPCRTWSRARSAGGGPRHVRSRDELRGTDGLTCGEKKLIAHDDCLLGNTIDLCSRMPRNCARSMEHPRDPGEDPHPSIWLLGSMKSMLNLCGGLMTHCDLGMFGWHSQKPTTAGSGLSHADSVLGLTADHFNFFILIGHDGAGNFKTTPGQACTCEFARAWGSCHSLDIAQLREPGSWIVTP